MADIGYKVVITEWAPLTISTLTLILRLFVKARVEDERITSKFKYRKLGWDDILMTLAVLCQYAHASVMTEAWRWGLGRHIEDLSSPVKIHTIHLITAIKGLSLLPSLAGCSLWKKLTLYFILIVDPIINAATLMQLYAQCGPSISALWNPAVAARAHCENAHIETKLGYFQSGANALCDLILSLFPIVILWKLQMPARRKISLYAVLSTSYVALIASIIKTVQIGQLTHSPDFTYNFVFLQIWVCIECNVIMVMGNVPSLFPLLRMLWRKCQRKIIMRKKSFSSSFSTIKDSAGHPDGKHSDKYVGHKNGFDLVTSTTAATRHEPDLQEYELDYAVGGGGVEAGRTKKRSATPTAKHTPEREREDEMAILKTQGYTVDVTQR